MKILCAASLGMCFGVRDAIARTTQIERPADVTVYGQLVHNEKVLVELAQRGFQAAAENARSTIPSTPQILVTAHGISDAERSRLTEQGKELIDTTCPLVRRVHRAAQMLAAQGYYVVVVGRPGHVEVRGIVEDLPRYEVVPSPDEVRSYASERIGVVCQSTTPPRQAQAVLDAIKQHNREAEVCFIDTICQPTRDRQTALVELLPQVDAVVVVGGHNSNNTRELAELCRAAGKPAYHVQTAKDLDAAWFSNCKTVGLTAGTSTLDETIEEVYQSLCHLGTSLTFEKPMPQGRPSEAPAINT